ncbi:hypothetical protein EXN66_Car019030 [Channa argus]|uniref:Uncharacterized protein n=1 Tax=Channa argus TaxID=215402 RepID=A0A6G1QLA6_CHAAH|nr:hypothetical protein EXN66_Car019030 [Channa argus]
MCTQNPTPHPPLGTSKFKEENSSGGSIGEIGGIGNQIGLQHTNQALAKVSVITVMASSVNVCLFS